MTSELPNHNIFVISNYPTKDKVFYYLIRDRNDAALFRDENDREKKKSRWIQNSHVEKTMIRTQQKPITMMAEGRETNINDNSNQHLV